ncbi:MAG: ankyrin repeat domain-containing protein [archaeon]|nr:ankyrin repeat domain-containing protein [archaeon]
MGETPLFQAVEMEQMEHIKYLLEIKSDPNLSQIDGLSPLHIAVTKQNVQIVELLLLKGADPNQRTKFFGQTPVHFAIKNDVNPTILLLLVQFNGSLLIKDKNNKKPIDFATSEEMKETLKKLRLQKESIFKTPKKDRSFSFATPIPNTSAVQSKKQEDKMFETTPFKKIDMYSNTVLHDAGTTYLNFIEFGKKNSNSDVNSSSINLAGGVKKELFNGEEHGLERKISNKSNSTCSFGVFNQNQNGEGNISNHKNAISNQIQFTLTSEKKPIVNYSPIREIKEEDFAADTSRTLSKINAKINITENSKENDFSQDISRTSIPKTSRTNKSDINKSDITLSQRDRSLEKYNPNDIIANTCKEIQNASFRGVTITEFNNNRNTSGNNNADNINTGVINTNDINTISTNNNDNIFNRKISNSNNTSNNGNLNRLISNPAILSKTYESKENEDENNLNASGDSLHILSYGESLAKQQKQKEKLKTMADECAAEENAEENCEEENQSCLNKISEFMKRNGKNQITGSGSTKKDQILINENFDKEQTPSLFRGELPQENKENIDISNLSENIPENKMTKVSAHTYVYSNLSQPVVHGENMRYSKPLITRNPTDINTYIVNKVNENNQNVFLRKKNPVSFGLNPTNASQNRYNEYSNNSENQNYNYENENNSSCNVSPTTSQNNYYKKTTNTYRGINKKKKTNFPNSYCGNTNNLYNDSTNPRFYLSRIGNINQYGKNSFMSQKPSFMSQIGNLSNGEDNSYNASNNPQYSNANSASKNHHNSVICYSDNNSPYTKSYMKQHHPSRFKNESKLFKFQQMQGYSDLYEWLHEIKLQQYYKMLNSKGIYTVTNIIEDLRNEKIKISCFDIEEFGICLPGHVYRFLTKLEVDAGFIERKIYDSLFEEKNLINNYDLKISREYFLGCKISDKKKKENIFEIFNLDFWLKRLNLLHLKNNFIENGFEMVEFLILQMFSSVPIDEEILRSAMHIYDENERDIIIMSLNKYSKIFLKISEGRGNRDDLFCKQIEEKNCKMCSIF